MKTAFARTLTEMALSDKRVMLLTGDYCHGSLDSLKAQRPNQYRNCGTGEQAMVGIAAGLAIEGFLPVVFAITPFILERAFEQIKLDVGEQNLRVVLVGFDDYTKDGPTHNPLAPAVMVSLIKNIHYAEPHDGVETAALIRRAVGSEFPWFIRLRNEPRVIPREWPAAGFEA